MLRHARPLRDRGAIGTDVALTALVLPIVTVALVLSITRSLGEGAQAAVLVAGLVGLLLWVGARFFPDRPILVALWQGIPTGRASLMSRSFREHIQRRPTAYSLFLGLLATCFGVVLVSETARQRPLLDAVCLGLVIVVAGDLVTKRWPRVWWLVAAMAIGLAAAVAVLVAG